MLFYILFCCFCVCLQSERLHSVPTPQESGPQVPQPPLPPPPPPPLSLYPSHLLHTLSDSPTPLLNGRGNITDRIYCITDPLGLVPIKYL